MPHPGLTVPLLMALLVPGELPAQNPWAAADTAVRRLPVAAFPSLPAAIAVALTERGCTVPQSYVRPEPHNVVSGDLRGDGRRDWAVLCSRTGSSTILVFRGETPEPPESLATIPDRTFLQHAGGDQVVFSRHLRVVDRDMIARRARQSGEELGPSPPHQGLEDAFLEKGSVIWYRHRGRWISLPGAD